MFINTAKDRQCVCSNQIVYLGQCVYLIQIVYVRAMYVFKPDHVCSGKVYMFKPDGTLAVILVSEFSNQMAYQFRQGLDSNQAVCVLCAQEEKLEGENQYMCNVCNSKQNAVRSIQLQTLPPVLNLQLLRFVFDV